MIYCVMVSEECGDGSSLSAVFKSKEKAEKYCEIQNQLEEGYCYWVNEQNFYDKKVSMKTKIGKYYNYYIDIDYIEPPTNVPEFIKQCDEDNECWEMTENQKYTYKNYVEITEDCITAWSTVSYERAREIALNEFYKMNNMKYKARTYKVLISDKYKSKYLPYNTTICPICGGKIKHPYTGQVTDKQLQEDIDTCLLVEVIDENDNTLGYHAICKKEEK